MFMEPGVASTRTSRPRRVSAGTPSTDLLLTKPCAHFVRGFCRLGKKCGFAHNTDELRVTTRMRNAGLTPAGHQDELEAVLKDNARHKTALQGSNQMLYKFLNNNEISFKDYKIGDSETLGQAEKTLLLVKWLANQQRQLTKMADETQEVKSSSDRPLRSLDPLMPPADLLQTNQLFAYSPPTDEEIAARALAGHIGVGGRQFGGLRSTSGNMFSQSVLPNPSLYQHPAVTMVTTSASGNSFQHQTQNYRETTSTIITEDTSNTLFFETFSQLSQEQQVQLLSVLVQQQKQEQQEQSQ